jgi:hypothetical protein
MVQPEESPCDECIVVPMCKEVCHFLYEHILGILENRCNFKYSGYLFSIANHIKTYKAGGIQIRGWIDDEVRGITIIYEKGNITKVYEREVLDDKFVRKLYPERKEYGNHV